MQGIPITSLNHSTPASKYYKLQENHASRHFFSTDRHSRRMTKPSPKTIKFQSKLPNCLQNSITSPHGFSHSHDDHPGPSKPHSNHDSHSHRPVSKPLHSTAMAPRAMPSHKTPKNSPKSEPHAPKLHQTMPPGLLS